MKRRSEPDVGRRFTTESLFTFSSEFSDRRRRKATNEREKTYLDVSNDVESLKYLTFFFQFSTDQRKTYSENRSFRLSTREKCGGGKNHL